MPNETEPTVTVTEVNTGANVPAVVEPVVPVDDDKTLELKATSIYTQAEIIDRNVVLAAHVGEFMRAKDVLTKGPAQVLVDLLNDDAIDLDLYPRSGSIRVEGTNRPYDKYKRPTNDGKEVEGSWIDDLADRTAIGKNNLNYVDALKKVRDNTDGKDPVLAEMEPIKVKTEIAKFEQRQRRWRNVLHDALNVYHVMCDIQDKFPTVTASFSYNDLPDENGKPVLYDTPHCIYVQDKANPLKIKAFTPGEFLRLDVDKANAAGGTFSKLVETAARKRGAKDTAPQGSKTAEGKKALLTVAEFSDWVVRGANLVDFEGQDGRRHQAELGNLIPKWSDEEKLSMCNLYAALDSIMAKAGLHEWYEAQQGKAHSAEALARINKPAKAS
jgi:hypothetical protein